MTRKKGKRKRLEKEDPKGPEEHSFAMDKHKWWSEEDFACWSKGKKGKKGLSKVNDGFQKCGFRLTSQTKAFKDKTQNKGKGKDRKGKGKEGVYPQSGLSASETPNEGRMWPCLA